MQKTASNRLVLLALVAMCGCSSPLAPSSPVSVSATVRVVKPYSTSEIVPGEHVRVVLSADNLTAEHNADRPWVHVDYDRTLIAVSRDGDTFDVTALAKGRAYLFVCGARCGGDPLFTQPIITVFEVR